MSIPAERLREGQQILVRGKVSFSRLAQLVEGEALVKSIEQAQKRGQLYPTKVPHTTINLVDAQVIAANAAALTTEEQFVQEKIYTVKTGDNAGKTGYGLDNKSSYLPTILEMDPENAGQYRQLTLERDLASGIEVTLVLQVFKPAGYEKRGIGLQQIVLSEPVRYFSSGVDTSALAARGIVVNGPIRAVAGADAAGAAEPFATYAPGDTFVPANSQADGNGFPAPTPGAQGVVPAPSYASQAFPQSAPAAVATLAPAAVAPAAAPVAAPVETAEQTIARLTQQVAEQAAAQKGSGGGSPFDAPVASAPAGAPGPWDVPGQAAAAYQG